MSQRKKWYNDKYPSLEQQLDQVFYDAQIRKVNCVKLAALT